MLGRYADNTQRLRASDATCATAAGLPLWPDDRNRFSSVQGERQETPDTWGAFPTDAPGRYEEGRSSPGKSGRSSTGVSSDMPSFGVITSPIPAFIILIRAPGEISSSTSLSRTSTTVP
ncbi:hypothetical protein FHX37_1145 [Haloactinospora alba]|uniref:Uncharacterized protein n=1 Tax=Haloactinospora alba TaxID=405555 RepID=A0A543NHC1_9ACTN|nr:hypothetical protein FHX37_1145 [Haloactinospora alba]